MRATILATQNPNNNILINNYFSLTKPNQQSNQKKTRKLKFTTEEDKKLRELVEQFGENQWNIISHKMKNRNQRQCRERWKNYLSPELNNDDWSEQEDVILLAKFTEFGPKWKKISLFLKNRTANSIRNRLIKLIKKSRFDKSVNYANYQFSQFQTFSVPFSNIQKANQFTFKNFVSQDEVVTNINKKKSMKNDVQIHNQTTSPKKKSDSFNDLDESNDQSCNEIKEKRFSIDLPNIKDEISSNNISDLFWNNDDEEYNQNFLFDIDF